MDDSNCVHGNQRLCETDGQSNQLFLLEGTVVRHRFRQAPTLDVFGDEIRVIRLEVGADVLGRADSADPLAGLDFAPEPDPKCPVFGELGSDQFQGHPLAGGVFGQVDDTHPTNADS